MKRLMSKVGRDAKKTFARLLLMRFLKLGWLENERQLAKYIESEETQLFSFIKKKKIHIFRGWKDVVDEWFVTILNMKKSSQKVC